MFPKYIIIIFKNFNYQDNIFVGKFFFNFPKSFFSYPFSFVPCCCFLNFFFLLLRCGALFVCHCLLPTKRSVCLQLRGNLQTIYCILALCLFFHRPYYLVNKCLPFLLLRLKTALPSLVFILALNP